MKVLELRAMRGPNYWSVRRHKLIVMTLDLEDLEEKPTNVIPGFLERLEKMFPTMYEHRCSGGCPGGFFMRVKEGTWMGHLPEWKLALDVRVITVRKVFILWCLIIWKSVLDCMLQKLRLQLLKP